MLFVILDGRLLETIYRSDFINPFSCFLAVVNAYDLIISKLVKRKIYVGSRNNSRYVVKDECLLSQREESKFTYS
jgi:hypothetical protein